jgi:hypothetical protein
MASKASSAVIEAARNSEPFRRSLALIEENASSIGLKSGEYAGRKTYLIPLVEFERKVRIEVNMTAYLLSIIVKMKSAWWMRQLSMTITEFFAGNGFI